MAFLVAENKSAALSGYSPNDVRKTRRVCSGEVGRKKRDKHDASQLQGRAPTDCVQKQSRPAGLERGLRGERGIHGDGAGAGAVFVGCNRKCF